MKVLYLECGMGAAGDMLMASLLELLADRQAFIDEMNGLGIPGVVVSAGPSVKCGILGTHVSVTVNGMEEETPDPHHDHAHNHTHGGSDAGGEHHHAGMHEIRHVVSALAVPQKVRDDILAVYGLIAEAESHVHGKPADQVHFHEVGMMDAVADITGVCLLMDRLSPERVYASPVHVGSGQVRSAHGLLPVPAPATARILRGVPVYGGAIRGELCTPTGAALLRHFAAQFGDMPVMSVTGIGYGMGKKDFEAPNCVRAMLGETQDGGDQIVQLCCNLDDMTPEALGFAQEQLFRGGALDVFTTAVGMKKNRPGILLTCLCRADERESIIRLIFRHTSTLGIREQICGRYTQTRSEHVVQTKYGPVRIKESFGWGVCRRKAEYEDIAEIARQRDLTVDEVTRTVYGKDD